MVAERFSAALVSRLSLISNQQLPQGYYRSKLFIVPFSTNSLVAAAGPVLSLLERLNISPTLPKINIIRDNIEHELNAFRSRLNSITNAEEINGLAYYVLCATIDEIVGKSYMRIDDTAIEFCAFTPPSQDEIGPEQRFFDIANYIKERPNQYLDLIELVYYCLITGFEGIQHSRSDGRQVLDNLLEELYQLIQQHRVNKSYNLFKSPPKIDAKQKDYKRLVAIVLTSITVLLSGFLISYSILESKAKTVQFGHQIVAKLDD